MEIMTHRMSIELEQLYFENHDNCTSCKYEFQNGDTSHLGYDKDDNPLYVCDSCRYLLKETAVRYSFSKRPYEIPEYQSNLWRYMDFTKYVSMLSTQSLYFTRANQFEDLFEGAKGIIENKSKWDSHYLKFFKAAISNPPEGTCNLTEEEINVEANRLLKELEDGGFNERNWTFINCWHENDIESEAMWRLYSNFIDNAIAIKTTYKKLYDALGKNPQIIIGRIKYINMKHQFAGVNEAFWRKRKSYEHEKEVRAITYDYHCKGNGKVIPCNLKQLVEGIYISPTSPSWFLDLVIDVNKRYGYEFDVNKSDLLDSPFY